MPNIPAPPTGTGTLINVVPALPLAANYGQFITDRAGVWEYYFIKNSYDTDQHVFQMGVTSPSGFNGSTVAFVQTAAPTLVWTCEWSARRQGSLPSIPDPIDLVDKEWVLLHTQIEPEIVDVLPDGFTYVYTISGIYWYGHANPSQVQMFYPKAPWLADTNPEGRAIDVLSLESGLTDTPGNTSSNNDFMQELIDEFDVSKPPVEPIELFPKP